MTIEEIKDTIQTWIRTADDEYDREEMGRVCGLKEALHLFEKLDVPDTNAGKLINREAVLDLFAEKCDTVRPYHEVWQAVKDLSSVELEKCGDCISRSAIIGKCEDTAKATSESGEINTGFIMALDFIADYAKHMPSAEPESKPGKWIMEGNDNVNE